MSGFWRTETLRARLPDEQIVEPYKPELVVNCAYELRLGHEVYVTDSESKTKRTLAEGEQVRIPPGHFANLLTEETVRIPADALGLISARFKWKQRGLVNVSGFHVDPGYHGRILFSVFNAGPTPVVVARGDRLFLLWLSSLDAATGDVYDKPGRTSITSADVENLQGDVASPQALATRVESLERIARTSAWVVGTIAAAVIAALIGFAVNSALSNGGDSDGDVPAPTEQSGSIAPDSVTPVAQELAAPTD
ncbi:dCTP deaminase domain-containing protein [Candidatus Poriferisodalis sp.]|uniref:dCTP deaminase domain-containing protein n=1 Tax=Candidatus Poriferisodalis sp. TaxID=3101277 RepID=UPI003B011D16